MVGGIDAAIARGQAEMDSLGLRSLKSAQAIDLGAGFGMHSIPLANLGYSVLALDSSATLLEVLRGHPGARAITALKEDLTLFRRHLISPVALILCMGDTLTHLADRRSVEKLFAEVADCLEAGGIFISAALSKLNRFIPVRSDADRILTCFLEYEDETVLVHDILHVREGSGWRQRVSAYRKLRLSADWVVRALEARGLQVRQEPGPAGMVRVLARRPI
jgi:2-polyprenyl-3-methyl-5-hydroxy-6-metoxy-1,4-benzoquinol methylase